jgi:hypothetical protein
MRPLYVDIARCFIKTHGGCLEAASGVNKICSVRLKVVVTKRPQSKYDVGYIYKKYMQNIAGDGSRILTTDRELPL